MIQLPIFYQGSALNDVWLFHKIRARWARAEGGDEKPLEQAGHPTELKQTVLCASGDPA